jgi:small GTP-binding protein
MEKKYEDKFNVMIIGDEKVGKTAILERFLKKTFLSERKQTIGIEHYDKLIKQENKDFLFKVWDTAGQEKFRVMSRSYYQKAHGMILTCAINNQESFNNIRVWLNNIKETVGVESIQLIIIANKCDLENERVVSQEDIKEKAEELGIEYFETSAKTGKNVDEAFEAIFKKVYTSVYKKVGFRLSERNGDRGNNSGSTCCK